MGIYPVLFGLRDGATFATDIREYHRLGFVERTAMGMFALQAFWGTIDYFVFLLASGIWFWIVFDLVWNWRAGKPIFYVGHTALLDVKLGKKIWLAKFAFIIIFLLIFFYLKK